MGIRCEKILYKIACMASEILFLLRPSLVCLEYGDPSYRVVISKSVREIQNTRVTKGETDLIQRHEGNKTYQSCNESQSLILIDKTFARNLQY